MKSLPHAICFAAAFLTACVTTTIDANASVTTKFLKDRAKSGEPIVLGQWHAGFTEVKKYAETNGLPLMAVWSNGDNCSHCTKLESCMMEKVFKDWMKDSGVVFYFGCDKDTSADDKLNGKGYTWCWKNQSLNMYPFVRFYWKAKQGTVLADGTQLAEDTVVVDKAVIGDTLDKRVKGEEGAKNCVNYAKKMFKQYIPAKDEDDSVVLEPEPPAEQEPTVDTEPAPSPAPEPVVDAEPTPAPVLPCRCCTCPADCACRKVD